MMKMNLHKILKIGVLCTIAMISGCSNQESEIPVNHPNIIYILADDLGYGDLSCLNQNSKIPTPNLDKMAEQGVIFTDAHSSSSVCSPTRYGILTGRYSWRSRRQGGALWTFDPPLIEDNRLTVPQYLKNHGYQTACIGKWHLGMNWTGKEGEILKNTGAEKGWNIDFSKPIQNGPTTKGFDYFFGTDAPNYPPYCFIENDQTVGIPTIPKPASMYGNPGIMLENWDLYQVLPEMRKRAIKYINEIASSENPFFLYLPLTAPHTPIAPTKDHIGKSQAGAYGDFVHQVDAIVGQIMKTLDENNISENTLIIFTSDNGSPGRDGTNMAGLTGSVKKYGHHPSYIYRGIKSDIWEGGHHIPFIARWPGKIKPSTRSDELICLTDLFASCAAILNEKLPDHAGEDSYNILPALTGQNYGQPIRDAIVHLSEDGSFSIRQGKWKLVICPGSGGWSILPETAMREGLPMMQLYDLEKDIGEETNLYDLYPDVVYNLTSLLDNYVKKGRSTPGTPQKNTGKPNIWRFLKVRNVKYDTTMVDHVAVSKKVNLLNNVPIKFTKNGIDALTDGIRASAWYDDGYWAAVEVEDLDILVDLGKSQKIRKVTAGFLESQAHWIFHPLQVEFSLSHDGKEFYSIKSVTREKLKPDDDRAINDFKMSFETVTCRYIRMKAKSIKTCPDWHKGAGGKAWLFVDEIIVE